MICIGSGAVQMNGGAPLRSIDRSSQFRMGSVPKNWKTLVVSPECGGQTGRHLCRPLGGKDDSTCMGPHSRISADVLASQSSAQQESEVCQELNGDIYHYMPSFFWKKSTLQRMSCEYLEVCTLLPGTTWPPWNLYPRGCGKKEEMTAQVGITLLGSNYATQPYNKYICMVSSECRKVTIS